MKSKIKFNGLSGHLAVTKKVRIIDSKCQLGYKALKNEVFQVIILGTSGSKDSGIDKMDAKKALVDLGWLQTDDLEAYLGRAKTLEIYNTIKDNLREGNRMKPEAPEEWFEVFYRLKNGKLHPNPTLASHLYRSKEEFLSCYKKEEESFDLIKLRKVEL